MTDNDNEPEVSALEANFLFLVRLFTQAKKMGVPYTTSLDILRIVMMNAIAGADTEKMAEAVTPPEMKEPVQ